MIRRLLMLGVCFIGAAELLTLVLHQHRFVVSIAGIAVTLLLLGLRRLLGPGIEPASAAADSETGDLLRRWLSNTETLIHRSQSTRKEWDRHLRPVLARRFENATGARRAKDLHAFNATGRMLFGVDLWEWVDPANVSGSAGQQPGPGRDVLEQILQRLEQA